MGAETIPIWVLDFSKLDVFHTIIYSIFGL